MWVKATISGPGGRHTESAGDAQEEGDVATIVSAAIADYRKLYQDAPSFDYTIKISHA